MTNRAKFRFQLFSNRRKNSDAKRERPAVLVFEPLEDRQLLSVSSPADVAAATALVGSDSLAQDALIRLDDDALATTTDAASGLVVLSEQEMLELVSSNAVPDVQVALSPETLQLLREVKATGYTAGKRWFYYDKGENGSQWNSSGLTSGDLKDTIDAAAEAGLNGMVWKMDFDDLGTNAGPNESFLTAAKKYADSKHIEIIPTFGFVGGNAFLSRDATLVEGLPHEKIPMKVSGGKASIVADSSIQVADGDMESLNDLNNANPSNQNKWSKTDPSSNYAFKSSVRHGGSSSLLIKPLSNGSTNVVSSGKITVQPGISYTLSCWVKTKVNKIDWNVAEISIWDATREISYNYVDGTTNWHKVELEFQTSDDEITIYLKGTGDVGEEFYFDDVEITAAAKQDFLPIPREGTPVKVYKKVNNAFVPLVENVDWKLPDGYRKNSRGETTYKYNYEYGFYVENNGEWEKSIDIEIPSGSQIHNGDTIYVDYYTPEPNVWNSYAYSVCLSEQGLYDYIGEVVADIQRLIQPKTWFLAFDEITSGGNCETCHNSGLTTAQIFGRSVAKQYDIIKSVDPDAEVVVWSDMLDPNHNATVEPYQHVDGSLVDAVDYIPSDVIIACWYDSYELNEMTPEYVRTETSKTLKFFSAKGFRTIASTYYDWGGDEHGKGYNEDEMELTDLDRNTKGWLMAIRDCNNANTLRNNAGMFYTTWYEPGDYDYLPAFGDALDWIFKLQPNNTITSVSLNTTTPQVGQTLTANLSLSGANAQTAATYQWYRKEYAYDAENNRTLDWKIWKKIDNATGASYVVQAGDLGKELKVAAVGVWNYAGTASVETEAVSQAGPTQLSAPANPRETAKTETTITVAWDAVPGATGYRVAWRNKADSQDSYKTLGATTTSYKLTGLDNSASYVWKVQALNGDFTSARTVKPRQILPAPSATATATAKTVTVEWDAVPNANRYYVSYKLANGTTWSKDYNAGSKLSYTIKGLDSNTAYHVRVKAIGDSFDYKTSPYSATVRAKTGVQVQLAAPANPDATAKTATTITASWDAVPNASKYRFIWKNQNEASFHDPVILSASKTSYKITGLDPDAIYVWKVLALGDGDSFLNSPYCATQRDKPQQTLAAPANPDATAKTATTITASWDAVPNANGYLLIWKNQSDASYTNVTLGASTTSYKLTGLDNSATYVWKVLALGDGVDFLNSPYCATQRDKPQQALAAPANPDATAKTATTITASWDAVPNATGYRFIWKNQSDASFGDPILLSATKTSYKLSNLDNSATYVWKVLALGDGVDYANSPYCATQRDKPLQTLAAPNLAVAPASTALTLVWGAVPNAVGYSVSYKLAAASTWSNAVNVGTNLSYTISGLAQNTLYHARVRALGDGVDYASAYSSTVRAKTTASSSAELDSDSELFDEFFDDLDEENYDLLAANFND